MPTSPRPGPVLITDPLQRARQNVKMIADCSAWLRNPRQEVWMAPALSAPVGEGQPNYHGDVRAVQMLLNKIITEGYLVVDVGVLLIPSRLEENGRWDRPTAAAVKMMERRYFSGMAHPSGVIQPEGGLYRFMLEVISRQRSANHRLGSEMRELAKVMAPGGLASWNGSATGDKTFRKADRPEFPPPTRIEALFPLIISALDNLKLADTDMVLMALATIRAESSGFQPEVELHYQDQPATPATAGRPARGPVQGNTSNSGAPGHHDFDKYDYKNGNRGAPDGERYRGRGFIQLTGRDNYATVGRQIGRDLVNNPDDANLPDIAASILAQFLKNKEKEIRSALQRHDLARARRLVNGGSNGLPEFTKAFQAGRAYVNRMIVQSARHRGWDCR